VGESETTSQQNKQVHSRLRARLGAAKVETGTAIHFSNSKQLLRQMHKTRSTGFCKWLQQLGAPFVAAAEDADLAQNMMIDEENQEFDMDDVDDDVVRNDIDEFNHLNLTGGVKTIANEDLFVLPEQEQEERNASDASTGALLA
jgi:hypothetical protein